MLAQRLTNVILFARARHFKNDNKVHTCILVRRHEQREAIFLAEKMKIFITRWASMIKKSVQFQSKMALSIRDKMASQAI